MEALWNLEDKWKLTTQEAVLLFVCSAFAVIALCTATMLKWKAQRKPRLVNQDPISAGTSIRWSEPDPGSNDWITIKTVLMESMRWSEASKWEEGGGGSESGSGRRGEMLRPPPLLGLERCDSSIGWQSQNSLSPAVWQRPILMGEKCELPRHSGLILYDERGRLLDHSLTSSRKENIHEVEKGSISLYQI